MLCRGAPTTTRAQKPISSCAPCASPSGRTELGPSGVCSAHTNWNTPEVHFLLLASGKCSSRRLVSYYYFAIMHNCEAMIMYTSQWLVDPVPSVLRRDRKVGVCSYVLRNGD